MRYKLMIDKEAEEEIIAIVHGPSALTRQIEDLVRGFTGTDIQILCLCTLAATLNGLQDAFYPKSC